MNIGQFRIEDRPLFSEPFFNIQEAIDFSSNWTELSGLFTLRGLYSLQCYQSGELEYSGTSINTLIQQSLPLPDNSYNNTAICLDFSASGITQVEIKGRKSGSNCVSALCDFGNQTLSIRQWTGGVSTTLATRSYVWDDEYLPSTKVALCMYDSRIFVVVNGAEELCANCFDYMDQFGFSISVPTLDEGYPTEFFYAGVTEIYLYPNEIPMDETDLFVMFRNQIKSKLDNAARTYRDYATDKKSWTLYKDLGLSDDQWAFTGREINKPATEYYLKRRSRHYLPNTTI